MTLMPMRYKTYTWPHNPKVYTIDFQRKVAAHKTPFGYYQLQDLGQTNRVMRGEGEFVGEGAYEEFRRLGCVFYEGGPGPLVHPLWQMASVYFVSLRLEQVPQPDYVRYSFEFWEECGMYKGLAVRQSAKGEAASSREERAVFHQVVKGDTLWALAGQYGLTMRELTALNPQIKNPNLIRVGEEVRIK